MPNFRNILNLLKARNADVWSFFANWKKELSWPAKYQWKQFFKILTKKEKYFLSLCIILIFCSALVITRRWYLENTEIKPAGGGEYTEAAIGSPRYLNPVLSLTNDVDRDISSIIYSSLFRRGNSIKILPELAEKYSLGNDKKTYDIELRKNVKWHDGKTLNADDIIYTVNIIQNPDYRSPLKASLQGVEVEKVNDFSIRFKLKDPYDPFLENLCFGILPKHIWENIPPASFLLSENNLKPIGSGPYKISKLQKDNTGAVKNLKLDSFSNYFLNKPFIDKILFNFYKDEDAAISAFNSGDTDGISYVSANNIAKIKRAANLNQFNLPRYFAVFFNADENRALADKSVRQALLNATDKKEIIDKTSAGQAVEVNSPLPDFIFGQDSAKIDKYPGTFNLEQAKSILETNNWKISSSTSTPAIRQKTIDNQNLLLEVNLLTVSWPELIDVANILKVDWEKLNIKVNVEIKSFADIQESIKNRQYQALLFGQILGANPDPYSFWHSSQKKDPGLNLSLYENKDADKLLENIRKESNFDIKIQEYNQFQKIIVQDIPAIFLYGPLYIYPTDNSIKGIDLSNAHLPQDRFAQISKWYIKTRRAWR